MSAPTVDTHLVTRICRETAAGNGHGTVEVVGDPLDGTAWVRMASWPHAREALTALNSHGISGHDCQDGRPHVTGWDVRLLHWRLGALLAGVDDLTSEWDATAEMVCYHHDRRVAAGVDPDPAEVLADVETAMRRCVPIPHRAPRVQDIDSLLELITAAEDAYQQLIAEHVDYAERVLTEHTRRPQTRCGMNTAAQTPTRTATTRPGCGRVQLHPRPGGARESERVHRRRGDEGGHPARTHLPRRRALARSRARGPPDRPRHPVGARGSPGPGPGTAGPWLTASRPKRRRSPPEPSCEHPLGYRRPLSSSRAWLVR